MSKTLFALQMKALNTTGKAKYKISEWLKDKKSNEATEYAWWTYVGIALGIIIFMLALPVMEEAWTSVVTMFKNAVTGNQTDVPGWS